MVRRDGERVRLFTAGLAGLQALVADLSSE
jgi:hypothetical protein